MTRKMYLIAGVAGLALTTSALAEKGGRDDDKKSQSEDSEDGGKQAERKESQERPQRQEQAQRPERQESAERQERGERQEQRFERQERGERQEQRFEQQKQRAEQQKQRFERQEQRFERQDRDKRQERGERQEQRFEYEKQRAEHQKQRFERQEQRHNQRDERYEQRDERREQFREARQDDRQQQRFERRSVDRLFAPRDRDIGDVRTARFDGRGYRPFASSFERREMRQMKPFKAMFDNRRFVSIGDRYDGSRDWSPVPAFYGSRYSDTDQHYYRYDDDLGYAYQVNRRSNVVSSLFPLFGGYGVGDPWPQTYYSSYVPAGYRDYYYDTPDYHYRNDGYGIYQVDSGSQLITALVSLVMGQSYGIGQSLPASYGAYNVPLAYRANYQDNDDSWYRYGDGYIYQMDPVSRRVEERYPLYTDNYEVGQSWPVAYPDYNVPYGYRSAYQDTPQYQYRYANDGIYQVDPTNQLIMALVALISGDQFAVGQQMPIGYDTYNVPVDYRDRYVDSNDEYYRYANGNVYRVDYDTRLIEEAFPVYG